MKRPPPRAVVFDLDGTLVDSLSLVLAAIAHGLEPLGIRPTMEIFAQLGGPPERFMPGLVKDAAQARAALARMQSFHEENIQLIRPYEGVKGLLEGLRASGTAVAIWTGRDRVSCDWLLREHGFDRVIAASICGNDLATHKPDPAGLQEIMRRLGVATADTLYVGDSDVDVLGGVGAGVDTVLIQHVRAIAPAISSQAWRQVPTTAEAYALVRTWAGVGG